MLFRAIFAASLMLLADPSAALACAVCGTSGPTDNGWAYFAMTMVLSGLPLCMIGGVVFWVYRRAASDDPPTVP
jgi:hypothetical protein